MRSHLLNDTTAEHYRRSVTEGVERVAAKLAATDRPFTGVTVDALAPRIERIDLDKPLHDTAAVLDELEDVYLRDAIYFHHPRYLAHLNCPVVIPAVLGEAVLSAVNSSLDTWDQSAGGTLIERKLVDWTTARIGLGPAADGVFTSGGTQSNLQALLLAREEAKAESLADLRIFASEVSHFSVKKSAKLLGLGQDSVVSVPVDHDKRMQTVALARELERCREAGLTPMAVVATAGTTDFGSIDRCPRSPSCAPSTAPGCTWTPPTAAAARLREVPGPHRRHRASRLRHRRLPQVLLPAGEFLRRAGPGRGHPAARHLPRRVPQPAPDGAGAHPQPGGQVPSDHPPLRRPQALDDPAHHGRRRHRAALRRGLRPGRRGWQLLAADPRFDVVVQPSLSTLVFRYIPPAVTDPAEIDRANLYARKALFASGDAVVAGTKVAGRHYLKFTLLNPETTPADIAAVLDLIAGHAEQYLGDSLDRAS